jgi:uncharacterized protein YbjT (DUF2867 family)
LFFNKLLIEEAEEMIRKHQRTYTHTIVVLGGTGHVGIYYIDEFLAQGFKVRVLARSPEPVTGRFPEAEVIRGSMMDAEAVREALKGADGAFLITPIGGNDDPNIELRAARAAITAAQVARLPHLIFSSVIQPSAPSGIPLLDVKLAIEGLLEESTLPWSALRTGCYMEDWLEFSPSLLNRGIFFFPISPTHQLSFTSQRDVSRVAAELLRQHRVLYGSMDVIEPVARTLNDVARLYSEHLGRKVVHAGAFLLPLMKLLRPVVFRWLKPVLASKVRLASYFDAHDWFGNPSQLATVLPGFPMTSMERYLEENHKKITITPEIRAALDAAG